MKKEDLKIKIIYDCANNQYLACPVLFPSILVTVDNIEDIPKEIGERFKVLFHYSLDEGNIEYEVFDYEK